ncbi:PHD finger-like domain-containing protein 5A [Arachis duranensis]|uniref:PHD finger-like domain-containing protein 5A n=1 Tax=Arachis duranensis TaxID=130453 RepID=A0A9C6TVY6_ARADU|nr:PHD finger-like domain-containing protein 5A [Arachis duranensis]
MQLLLYSQIPPEYKEFHNSENKAECYPDIVSSRFTPLVSFSLSENSRWSSLWDGSWRSWVVRRAEQGSVRREMEIVERKGGEKGNEKIEIRAKHHPDLIMCRKQPGIVIGRLCEKCDGKCVICDSYVRPCTLVRVCGECNYDSFHGRCVICERIGISDAYYCKECTQQEKDRDGCPKIVNLGSAKTDLFYERKKYGFKKR